jgi:heptosyltransferase-2
MIVSTVVRSLKTGMTTDSSGSAGTAGAERGTLIEAGKVPHALGPGKRLVVVAPNWLGDAVMALPAIRDVRAHAAAAIAVAARPAIAPLFTLVPGIDEVLELRSAPAAVERLRQGRFDGALLLPNSFQSAFTAWRAGIPERWGYRADGRALLLTHAIPRPAAVHQAVYYQRLVVSLGIPSGRLEPRLEAPLSARAAGGASLAAIGWDGRTPLVAMAPGAAYGGAKRWPAERFAALASALAQDGIETVLIGSAADAAAAGDVARAAGRNVLSLVGRTDLPALAGVLASCRALVSNDSGAMHFAAALGVPVIAIFGPTNERETHPLAAPHGRPPAIHTRDVWCRPCMLRECPLVHRCMRGVTVDAVLPSVRSALAGAQGQPS